LFKKKRPNEVALEQRLSLKHCSTKGGKKGRGKKDGIGERIERGKPKLYKTLFGYDLVTRGFGPKRGKKKKNQMGGGKKKNWSRL